MIDPHHDIPVPNIDPGHKVFTDEELKRIKDSFPKRSDIKPTWQEVALELAVVVNRQRIHRMHSDMLLGWELAKEVLKLKRGVPP